MKIKVVVKLFNEITEELKAGNQMRLNVWVRLALFIKSNYEAKHLIEEIRDWAAKNPKTNFAGLVASYIENEHNRAFDIFNNIVANYDPKKDTGNLEKTREYLNALLNRGNINEQIRGEIAPALADYTLVHESIIKSDKKAQRELDSCLACACFSQACLALKTSQDEAIALFAGAASLDHPRAKRSLAYLLKSTAPEQAEQLLLAAASLGDYPAYLELARIKQEAGDTRAAKQNYLKALDFGDQEAKEELFRLLKTEMMSQDQTVAQAAFTEFASYFLPDSDQHHYIPYQQAYETLLTLEQNTAQAQYWLARILDQDFDNPIPGQGSSSRAYNCALYHYYRALQLDNSIKSREKPCNMELNKDSINYCIRCDSEQIKTGNWQPHPELLKLLGENGEAKKIFAEAICQIADPIILLNVLKYALTPGNALYELFATSRALIFKSRPKINTGTFLKLFENIRPDVKKDLITWLSQDNNALYKILDADEKEFLQKESGVTPAESTDVVAVPATRTTTYSHLGASRNPLALMGGTGAAAAVMARAADESSSESEDDGPAKHIGDAQL